MENLVCAQCGGNLFNKLLDGNYQCLYCQSIMMSSDGDTKILSDTVPEIIHTEKYDDPELAELCGMELEDMRERLCRETDSEQANKLQLKIKDLEKELNNIKSK